MARLSITPHPDFGQRPGESYQDHMVRCDALMDELEARSDALPSGQVVGAILKFQVADGYAFYEVMSEKPLVLRHIEYMDGYRVDPALIRGLRLVDVQERVFRQLAIARFFGSRTPRASAV